MRIADLDLVVDGIKDKSITLFVVRSSVYNEFNLTLLDLLMNKKKMKGVYVTVNRPYEALIDYLKRNKIDPEKLYFVDVVSKMVAWNHGKKLPNCEFLEAPSDLTGLSIAIEEISKKFEKKDTFLFLDSLSTLFIYNHSDHVTKFMHFMISKLRINNIGGVLISVERDIQPAVLASIIELCDKAIYVESLN